MCIRDRARRRSWRSSKVTASAPPGRCRCSDSIQAPAGAWIESEHLHRPGGALAVTFEDLHDRRLASAVGPKKGVDLAPPNLETHPVDGTQPTVVLAQSLDHDGGRLAGRHTFHATD